jgi:sulfotransferase family protein
MGKSGLLEDFRRFWRRLLRKSHSSTLSAWASFPAPEALIQHAREFFRAEVPAELPVLAVHSRETVAHFNIDGMQKVLAICTCGSSGSLLLASYLDGHPDVLGLPQLMSQSIYPFFYRYQSMPLEEKLIAYPFFSKDGNDGRPVSFFHGDKSVSAADYYSAVKALIVAYRDWPSAFLESSRAFFLFLHMAYHVALGRRPGSSAPVIVFAQHIWDNDLASALVGDFPQTRFIHTVRDPISNFGRHLARYSGPMAAGLVVSHLTYADVPHSGMESRTLAIRFEDLHLQSEEIIRMVIGWLGLPFHSSLLESTFNGIPFTVTKGAVVWSGARPEQAIRDIRNVSFTDRCLIYAVLYEDFIAWDYPCPGIFKIAAARILVCAVFLIIPFRIELIVAASSFKSIPAQGFRFGLKSLSRIIVCRLAIMFFLAAELSRRIVGQKEILSLKSAGYSHAPLERSTP